ncbi:hypothetical protein LTR53_002011 [Teratosphaeriaceae sp. CCFEE 6253]|nr:hypothetical protein LTR53_002011 [Teratosphaeriaceae sp. CCFEE 6253]
MRQSIITSALCLTLVRTAVDARAHDKFSQLELRDGQPLVEEREGGLLNWVQRLARGTVQRRQAGAAIRTCDQDDDFNKFVRNGLRDSQSFCQNLLDYPNQTITTDYTPTSIYTYVYTTDTITQTVVVTTTPIRTITVTSTLGSNARREANPQITAPAEYGQAQIAEAFNMFRRQNGISSSANDSDQFAASFSSACSCQNYSVPTFTATYTHDPTVVTHSAYDQTVTTLTSTRVARANSTTITVVVPPPTSTSSGMGATTVTSSPAAPASSVATSLASTTAPTSAPIPTSPSIFCPQDNGEVISQMVGAERFDYFVNCSTDLTSPISYGALYLPTLGQCVGACSMADAKMSRAACQGVSYHNSPNVDGYNCFLKAYGNVSVSTIGVDSAVLLRIVMGVDGADSNGTTTEAAPFGAGPATMGPSQMSASMAEALGNSTTTMPMTTPGPSMAQSGLLVNTGSGFTSVSTYISAGSTFSSGTAYSTYYTSNGSWFSSYYTSYTLQWASATTEYAIGAQETQISGSHDSSTSEASAEDGGYSIITDSNSTSYFPGGYNVTEVISNQTYAANGSEISSSATTNFHSYQTGAGSSGSGGDASGGIGGSSNGSVTSTAVAVISTTLYSSQTIIANSGAAAGASANAASGAIVSPSTSTTTITVSGGSAFSSGFAASGGAAGTGGASGNAGSGAITGAAQSTGTIVTVINGTAYSSGFAASGSVGGAGGASGYAASGSIGSTAVLTVVTNTTGFASSSGFLASGSIGGTGGVSGTAASGSLPSPSSPISTPNAPRTGLQSTTTPVPPESLPPAYSYPSSAPSSSSTPSTGAGSRTGSQGPPLSTGPAPYSSPSGSPPSYGFSSPVSTPFDSRTGLYSTTTPGTAPASSGSPVPSANSTTSLAPTAPVGYPAYSIGSSSSPVSTPFDSRTGLYSTTAPASSGSPLPSMNSTVAIPTGTAPSMYTFPTTVHASTCGNMTVGTTTMWMTTTEYGCYSSCAPSGGYGYSGGPHQFGGGPGWGAPRGPPMAAAATSSSPAGR